MATSRDKVDVRAERSVSAVLTTSESGKLFSVVLQNISHHVVRVCGESKWILYHRRVDYISKLSPYDSYSSLGSTMKAEEKNSAVPRVRIAVLGKINVGKSALTVRYLTRRYIGEYRSNTDLLYRQTVTVNNTPLDVEIVDVSGETRDSIFPLEQVQWADACVVVYSITDKQSFEYAVDVLANFQKLRPVSGVPVTLLANKADLEHLRKVDEEEGRAAALHIGCQFYEVSVAENSSDLYQAFETLVNECRSLQANNTTNQKTRKFSVSKMLGTLIGNGNGKTLTNQTTQGGTVVVCHKSDLHRSRVLKRRQNFTATASL